MTVIGTASSAAGGMFRRKRWPSLDTVIGDIAQALLRVLFEAPPQQMTNSEWYLVRKRAPVGLAFDDRSQACR